MSDSPPRLEDYDFELPANCIAQRPVERRSDSRLLHWHPDGSFQHRRFEEMVEVLRSGDLLVLNDTRVFPARLFGTKCAGEARVEILLVAPRSESGAWGAMVRPGRRLPPGTRVKLDAGVEVEVGEAIGEGERVVRFDPTVQVLELCQQHGHIPLPPYIEREDDAADHERYQTVFARETGSVAAPTAGLHFDQPLLDRLEAKGVARAWVTLHVGPGTFRPPTVEQLEAGRLHAEHFEVPAATLDALRATRRAGGRVVAVGTTACRTLESLELEAKGDQRGDTQLLIAPGHAFRWVDALVTNFHLPRSSLLMLVAALAPGRWRAAYEEALCESYRFYSYGDANFIERKS